MRYFIKTDDHANLEALETVVGDMRTSFGAKFLKEGGKDRLVNLGDVVGYMPYPNECMDLTFSLTDENIVGNHDIAASGGSLQDFNQRAAESILWTRNELRLDNRRKLWTLGATGKYTIRDGNMIFAHSTPIDPQDMVYVENKLRAYAGFFREEANHNKFAFVGHIHVPQLYKLPSGKTEYDDIVGKRVVAIDDGKREVFTTRIDGNNFLAVVPSVGQPRDGCSKTGYVVFDSDDKTLSFVRLPYDIEKTQRKMTELGFDQRLIDRLAIGR